MNGKWFENNWLITIIGGVFSVFLLRLIHYFFIDNFFWGWIKNGLIASYSFFNTVYPVKLYYLFLFPLLSIVGFYGLLFLIAWIKNPENISNNPPWIEYTKDVFNGIQYRWKYYFGGGEYEIINLQKFCDQCSCSLVNSKCPACEKLYHHNYGYKHLTKEELEALISQKIDTGTYKKTKYFSK